MTPSICDFLRESIKSFLATQGESVRWLMRKSGVDYSTVYRITTGEQKRLSFINAKKLLYVINPENAAGILEDYYPRESNELGIIAGADELAAILADDLRLYQVYAFAEIESNSREQVKEQFGLEGIKNLDKLLELGILIPNGTSFRSTLEGRAYPPEAVIKKTAIHHFSMVSLSTPGSNIDDMRGGLTDEGIKEAYDATVEYREKMLKIYDERKGARLFVTSVIAGPAGDGK